MVDIVDFGLAAQQLDQIFDDGDDVFLCQDLDVIGNVEVQFAVDAVTTDQAQIISLVGEEQLLNDATCRFLIGRLSITQLAVDVFHSLFFRVAGVFLQGLENDRIVGNPIILVTFHLAMEQNGLHAAVYDLLDMFILEDHVTVDDDLVTLDGNALAGILIDEILVVGMKHTSSQLAAKHTLQTRLRHLHLFGEVEDIEDVLVSFVTDGTQQGGDR